MSSSSKPRALLSLLMFCLAVVVASSREAGSLAQLHERFVNPSDDARIMMRWWWFGPAVDKSELERELRVMKTAGIGGVEIQPVYPLELDDPSKNFHNLTYLSDDFLAALHFTAETAKELGMRVDITLGSGWPYGGPDTTVNEAAGHLRCERTPVPTGAQSAPVPAIENGESLIAVFLAPGDKTHFSADGIQRLTEIQNGRVQIPVPVNSPHVLLFFISSRTGQQVKRPSVGAEGFVLNHYDRSAIAHHLTAVGDRLMQGFGPNPPYAVFSDSLEVYGSDWSADFLDEFQKRRGYDLTPYLPALVGEMGDQTLAVRHDWGRTLTELAEANYLEPIREWAHAHHTLFRSQTYGEPPVILSSNALVDLAEGEAGPRWRTFNTARWASSANHLYGKTVTSTETWTWLHAPSFRATPLDMKAEADLHFIEGVNQLIGHGWPYSPPSAGEPGWRFYAAASFNDHNPWFQVMPEIARYLQRVSFLMRQGSPPNDIAIYLPTDDAWANFKPGKTSIDRQMESVLGPELIPQILDAGFNFDYIDDRAIAAQGVPSRVLILPGVERIPLATLEKIQDFVQKGGFVVATLRTPSLAPGVTEAKTDNSRIRELSNTLFQGSAKNTRFLRDDEALGDTIKQFITPDLTTGAAPHIGFVHRKLTDGDIYFLANTSNQAVDTQAVFRISRMQAAWWDPFTGDSSPCSSATSNETTTTIPVKLAPYESRILVFTASTGERAEPRTAARSMPVRLPPIDISSDWKVTFSGLGRSIQMSPLRSWTEEPQTRYYSGQAVYEKPVDVPQSFVKTGRKIVIDFGPGQTVEPSGPPGAPGMHALLESPVRECALVFINNQQAGSIWHPPYELDITRFVHVGSNQFRFVVANLAINEMAGRALPNYKLLNLRYGERFVPQGFENLKPLPAGIVGSVHLVER